MQAVLPLWHVSPSPMVRWGNFAELETMKQCSLKIPPLPLPDIVTIFTPAACCLCHHHGCHQCNVLSLLLQLPIAPTPTPVDTTNVPAAGSSTSTGPIAAAGLLVQPRCARLCNLLYTCHLFGYLGWYFSIIGTDTQTKKSRSSLAVEPLCASSRLTSESD